MSGQAPGETLRNIRLVIEYEGTNYAGWQWQDDRPTVQGEVMGAIGKVLGERPTVYGASRTDAGVHARGQVANFRTRSGMAAWKMAHALNAHLPEDIAVTSAEDAAGDFHAQFMAAGKWYRYSIRHDRYRSALDRGTSHLVRGELDFGAMERASADLRGTHDFRAMATQVDAKKNTVRTLTRVAWSRDGAMLRLDIEGSGFLYNMVRTIVGTLLNVGKGALPPDAIPGILASADRRRAGPVAPARGLCLMQVFYAPAAAGAAE